MGAAAIQETQFRDDLRAPVSNAAHYRDAVTTADTDAFEDAVRPSEDEFRVAALDAEERQEMLAELLSAPAVHTDGVHVVPVGLSPGDLDDRDVEDCTDVAHDRLVGHLQHDHRTLLEHREAPLAIHQAGQVRSLSGCERKRLDGARRHADNDRGGF